MRMFEYLNSQVQCVHCSLYFRKFLQFSAQFYVSILADLELVGDIEMHSAASSYYLPDDRLSAWRVQDILSTLP